MLYRLRYAAIACLLTAWTGASCGGDGDNGPNDPTDGDALSGRSETDDERASPTDGRSPGAATDDAAPAAATPAAGGADAPGTGSTPAAPGTQPPQPTAPSPSEPGSPAPPTTPPADPVPGPTTTGPAGTASFPITLCDDQTSCAPDETCLKVVWNQTRGICTKTCLGTAQNGPCTSAERQAAGLSQMCVAGSVTKTDASGQTQTTNYKACALICRDEFGKSYGCPSGTHCWSLNPQHAMCLPD